MTFQHQQTELQQGLAGDQKNAMKIPLQTFFSSLLSKGSDEPPRHKIWSLLGLVIIGLFGGLYFFHVTAQQEYLTKRNFRILESWNQELTNKIQSFESIFQFPSQHRVPTLIQHPDGPEQQVGLFSNPKNAAPLSPDELNNMKWWDVSCIRGEKPDLKDQKFNFFLAYRTICDTGLTNITLKVDPSSAQQTITTDSKSNATRTNESSPFYKPSDGLHVSVPKNNHDATFSFTYIKNFPNQDFETLNISAELNLDKFLGQLTDGSAFDDVLIFDSTGKVIYQKSTFTFNWNNWGQLWEHTISQSSSSLLQIFNSETATDNTTRAQTSAYDVDRNEDTRINVKTLPTAFTISVSDTNYKVFAQASDHLSSNKEFLVICGIVATDRLRQESLAISSTSLLIIMIILGIVVLSLPLLRLKMIGPTDPLRLSHTFMLVLSSFVGAGLLTFLFLDFVIYKEAKGKINTQIEKTANAIHKSMKQELSNVLTSLKRYDTSTGLTRHVGLLEEHASRNTVLLEEGLNFPCNRVMVPLQIPPQCYDDYLYAFWTDHEGKLRINWTNRNEQNVPWKGAIHNVDLHQRLYVDQVLNHKTMLWHLDHKNMNIPFYLEPITSWSTGKNSVVASIPSRITDTNNKKHWVAAMEFQLHSLMKDLILPPQAGFAIIRNDNYQVLFHSTTSKNLRENFLAETNDDPLLRDLVFARTSGHFDGKYWGEDAHFYVMPIGPMPWSIVVYQKQEMLQSVNFVILLISGGLFSTYSILALISAGLFMGLFQWEKHRKAEWLWPQKIHHEQYNGIAVTTMFMCLIGMILLWQLESSPGLLLLTGIMFPMISMAVLAAVIYIVRNASKEHTQMKKRENVSSTQSFTRSYSYLLVSFLVLGAVLPALFIFKSVFFQEMSLVVKHQLMALYQDSRSKSFYLDSTHVSANLISLTKLEKLTDNCRTSDLPYGLYPNIFVETNWCIHSLDGLLTYANFSSFDKFYQMVSQPFIPLRKNIQEWGFLHTLASSNDSQGNDQPNVLSYKLPIITQDKSTIHLEGPLKNLTDPIALSPAYLKIWATVPLQPWILLSGLPTISFEDIPWWLLVLLLFTGYVTILYKIPRFIADQVLFLSYTIPIIGTFPPQLLKNGNTHSPNLIILGYPGQGKSSLLTVSQTTPQPIYLDLRGTQPNRWKSTIETQRKKQDTNIVLLDHFEWGSDEHKMTQAKLELLEKLLGWNRNQEAPAQKTPQGLHLQNSRLIIELGTDKKDISS